MRQLLREFVSWMEQAYQEGRVGSAFEQPVQPNTLVWAKAALELALNSGRTVLLFTRAAAARSMVAGLVFDSAGVKIDDVYNRNLNDDDFDRLTAALTRMKTVSINFEEGLPRTPGSVAGHLADGRFILCC